MKSLMETLVLRSLALAAVLLLATRPLSGQTETVLKEYFEGRMVSPKLAMPGTEDGVDVYPGSPRPLDYSRYANRLKEYGTAIRAGEPVTVTKVRMKSKHIEFQLGGGGYGTFSDETSSTVSVPPAPITKREKNLDAELKRETDPGRKRALKEELDELKSAREREDARNRSALAEAQEHRKQNIRQRRMEGGSRFNLRYTDRVPREALTPEAVIAALRQYVDFGELGAAGPEPAATAPRPAGGLRKGMLLQEVDAVLGSPLSNTGRKEGRLNVMQRTYSSPMGQVSAEFVEGVLIRYTVTSE
jgi:hypothetical protein